MGKFQIYNIILKNRRQVQIEEGLSSVKIPKTAKYQEIKKACFDDRSTQRVACWPYV